MCTGLLRVVSALVFAPVVLLPSIVHAQGEPISTPRDSSGSAGAAAPAGAPIASTLRSIGSGVSAPVVLFAPNPQFSDQARKAKLSGTVLINLIVDAQGQPQNVHVLRGVGMGLDASALLAVKQYKFKPAMEGGKPVAVELNVEVNFQIRTKDEGTNSAATGSAQSGSVTKTIPISDDSAKYVVPGCAIDHTKPSEADAAMAASKDADAERLYNDVLSADPASTAAMAGLVRTTLAEGKLPEALALAVKDSSANPNDPVLLDVLAEVRFRRGEMDEAGAALNQSVRLDRCNGITHLDMARYLDLLGWHAGAQRNLEIAHAHAPENLEIAQRWSASHAAPPTAGQRLAMLKKMLENPSLTDAQKEAINGAMKGIESSEKSGCELVSPLEAIDLPIVPVPDNGSIENMKEGGLDLQINGKKKRLEIDTGSSGLTLSASSAKTLGLVPEAQTEIEGSGGDSLANAFVTHVDDIRIGTMEFKNCMIRVLGREGMLDRVPDVDGLIGTDVFQDYLVTLDYPGRELRLGPLPALPGQQETKVASLSTMGDKAETPMSLADSAKDRYIAPEMKDWTPVFRSGHMLIVPTLINSSPAKLFLLDTGAAMSLISPSAAKEVGQVSDFTGLVLKGADGVIQKVPAVSNVSMKFGQIEQTRRNMLILDTGGATRNAGVEISGRIGIPVLRELVLSIDYRDNLVQFVYDPKKGFHARNGNGRRVN